MLSKVFADKPRHVLAGIPSPSCGLSATQSAANNGKDGPKFQVGELLVQKRFGPVVGAARLIESPRLWAVWGTANGPRHETEFRMSGVTGQVRDSISRIFQDLTSMGHSVIINHDCMTCNRSHGALSNGEAA